ncbi:hypothetical protein BSU04_11885 [Caballeronia sordidicola]|uniref:Uncharacterized protein n=1 Tax=Caballeronia sordidicola TaxID=196367 RepID=A0A226X4T4_CABSO|nr:hypothetical protein BSU04_11885 [Caballeronia sordidicola]
MWEAKLFQSFERSIMKRIRFSRFSRMSVPRVCRQFQSATPDASELAKGQAKPQAQEG